MIRARQAPEGRRLLATGILAVLAQLGPIPSAARASPDEAGNLRWEAGMLAWDEVAGATGYNLYRAARSHLLDGFAGECEAEDLPLAPAAADRVPPAGGVHFFLVSALDGTGESTLGAATSGLERTAFLPCAGAEEVRRLVLGRLGPGHSRAHLEEVRESGVHGYLAQQLDPASIDESTNADLNDVLGRLAPPALAEDLESLKLLRHLYARRELLMVLEDFWDNHFNTDLRMTEQAFTRLTDSLGDPLYTTAEATAAAVGLEWEEAQRLQSLALGRFADLLTASATSLPMMIYLDTYVSGMLQPNENYARELLELHTVGVDAGYGQADVEAIARAFTGWTLCNKDPLDADDPHSACLEPEAAPGVWALRFEPANHDFEEKVVFAGTPQELVVPDRSGAPPEDGYLDGLEVLQHLAAHPATVRRITTKLVKRFVSDAPPQGLVDRAVATWEASGGEIREVLRTILFSDEFRTSVRAKVRTPFEFALWSMRVLESRCDSADLVLPFLNTMNQVPYFCADPSGYPESGAAWLDTAGLLERQNLGFAVAAAVGADCYSNVEAIGVEEELLTSGEIVDFYGQLLLGGWESPAQRQEVLDFLETDDAWNPVPLTGERVRQTVGLMLGFPQAQEQ